MWFEGCHQDSGYHKKDKKSEQESEKRLLFQPFGSFWGFSSWKKVSKASF